MRLRREASFLCLKKCNGKRKSLVQSLLENENNVPHHKNYLLNSQKNCVSIKLHQNQDKFIQTNRCPLCLSNETHLKFQGNLANNFNFDENQIRERDSYDYRNLRFYVVMR